MRHLTRPLAVALLAGTCTLLAPTTPTAQAKQTAPTPSPAPAKAQGDSMPITGITLYRSGVGSFIRSGVVEGSTKVSLKFDVNQINDVLKSLQILDLDNGRVDSVTYASKDPLARRLSSFSLNLADNPALPTLFERLRGSPVKIKTFSDGTATGTVLSVESRRIPSGSTKDAPIVDTPVVNIILAPGEGAGGIRSIPIPTIATFSIEDARLADEMSKALAAIAESRAERIKSVDLALSGEGQRRVAAAYVHETPVWKTSYRLILPEAPNPAKADPANIGPVLKGWALVENTTDSDWTGVKLALVSGRPVSFAMDLSEPMYVFRPEVPVPTVAGVMPREYEGGSKPGSTDAIINGRRVTSAEAQRKMNVASRSESGRAGAPADAEMYRASIGSTFDSTAGLPPAAAPSSLTATQMADYGMPSGAKGMEVGEQFQYEVSTPVTIERQRSAMIPIIDANIQGRRVSIYNMADRPDHPLRGVEIVNTSGLQLLPGPISVYDGAAYAGDAQVGQVSIGDKRLLAYALDTDIAVQTEPVSDNKFTKLRIIDGLFEQTIRTRAGTTYTFDNKDLKRGRNLMVEHPKLEGFTLAEGGTPAETTQALLRFNLTLEPGKQNKLKVVQERINNSRVSIETYSMPQIIAFQKDGVISQAVLDAVRTGAKKNAGVNQTQQQLADNTQNIDTAKRDQAQLTEMMGRLDRQNPNYASISERLGKSLKLLETLEKDRTTLTAKLDELRTERDDYFRSLNVE
ncbi:MAG: hypothetical protein ACK54T_09915 [bacterium]